MIETRGDIWDYACLKVVPTNIGWRKDGSNVMGRGVAQQAARRYPGLAAWYGRECQRMLQSAHRDYNTGEPTWGLRGYRDLILFPVKPLNFDAPWLSWRQRASLELIRYHTEMLAESMRLAPEPIALPLVGCGNGGLPPSEVLRVLRWHLEDDRFILVRLDA